MERRLVVGGAEREVYDGGWMCENAAPTQQDGNVRVRSGVS